MRVALTFDNEPAPGATTTITERQGNSQMKSTFVDRKTAVSLVYEALRGAIGRGELLPGAALRQEHLAARFGVSHGPIQEALNLLVSEGLATTRLHLGTAVSALSEAEALELAEYCGLLEGQLIRLAVPNLSRADLVRAGMVLDALDRATAQDEIVRLTAAFHTILYVRAERPVLLRAVDTARLNLGRYLRLTRLKPGNTLHSQARHRQLLRVCAAGNGEAAAGLMAADLHVTGQQVAQIIGERDISRSRFPAALMHARDIPAQSEQKNRCGIEPDRAALRDDHCSRVITRPGGLGRHAEKSHHNRRTGAKSKSPPFRRDETTSPGPAKALRAIVGD